MTINEPSTLLPSDPPVYHRFPERWHQKPVHDTPREYVSANHVAAGIIWWIACVTTWQFVASLGVRDLLIAVPLAILGQALLTVVEHPFWGRRRDAVAGVAVIADTMINAGGVWPWMSRLDQTPPWRMLAEGLQLAPGLAIVPALVLSLVFGYVLAAAPERVWKR